MHEKITISTYGRGIYNITSTINKIIKKTNTCLCNIFCCHTSASLIICENYDKNVKIDIEYFFKTLILDGYDKFLHHLEGPDDMPAHIRTLLTGSSLSVPVINNELLLGCWQSICLYEHKYESQTRKIIVTVI